MFQFKLPDIGEGVVEAELTRWCVKEGDTVAENQVLAELLTDKASIEIPSPKAGRVAKLHYQEGQMIQVGAVVIEIDDGAPSKSAAQSEPKKTSAEQPEGAAQPAKSGRAHSTSATSTQPPTAPPRPRAHALPTDALAHHEVSGAGGAIQAVPAVRDYARQMQVDLATITGTGPEGRIMRRDIDAVLARAAVDESGAKRSGSVRRGAVREAGQLATAVGDPADWKRVPLRGLRRTIAERMVQSKFTAPHYTYVEEIDMTAVEALRKRLQAIGAGNGSGEGYSPLVFIARAVVRTLPSFPDLNASLDEARGEIIYKSKIHLGVAAAVEDGLLVPVVFDAGNLSTPALAQAIRDLAQGAREGTLKPAQLKGSTFTISSLGKLGGIVATPILNPPEVAIIGVNAIRTLPRYLNHDTTQPVPRQMMNLSMSLDHRVVDGAVCSRFVAAVKSILESADFDDLPKA